MKFAKPMLAIALVSSLSFVNANAIGDREKGALIGAGAMLLLPTMVQNMGVLFGDSHGDYGHSRKHHHNPKPVIVEREKVIIIDDNHRYGKHHDRYNRHKYDRYDRKNRYHRDRYSEDRQIIIIQR